MGGEASKSADEGLKGALSRDVNKLGQLSISGRYHRLPRKLEDDYIPMSDVLGSGYNGSVFLAEHKETKEKFAVKGFKLHGVPPDKQEELIAEVEIFLQMDHPHVARLVDVYESAEQLSLVMECLEGGELFKRIAERKQFTEKDAADAAWQMLLALNYIHDHSVVHRDIKLENYLYEKEDSDSLKLIDFGFSKIWAPNTKMALSCGTLAYVAPEVLGRDGYTSKCDLWSLGVTVFILVCGYMPFNGREEAQMKRIKAGHVLKKPAVWDAISSPAKDFIESLLVVDENQRLSAQQALQHPWIAERDKMEQATHEVSEDVANALAQFGQMSKFRRACMEMMAWSLSSDDRRNLEEAFTAMDLDRSGTIKIQEFKEVLETKYHIDDENVKEAFASLDTNHTDEIHYTEFLAAMVSSRVQLHDDILKATFHRFDTDNSGYITVDNLRDVLGESFEGEEVEKLLEEADIGHEGKISYKQWIEYVRGGDAHGHHVEAAHRVIETEKKKAANQEQRTDEQVIQPSKSKVMMRQRTETPTPPGPQAAPEEICRKGDCCAYKKESCVLQ